MADTSVTILNTARAAELYRPKAVDRGETFAAVAQLGGRDATCTLWSDSTGNEDIEWFRLMVNAYAALHPKARVLYYPWNDATKAYLAAVEVQAGASSSTTSKPLVDTFTRTAADLKGSVAESGQVWGGATDTAGDWSVDGSKAVASSDATRSLATLDGGTRGDHRLVAESITMSTVAPASGTTKALFLRIKQVDATTAIYVENRITSAQNTTYLYVRTGGTPRALQQINNVLPAGQEAATFDVVLKTEGTAVTAVVNGVTLAGTLTDAELAALAPGTAIAIGANNLPGASIAGLSLEVTGTGAAEQTLHFYAGAMSGSTLDYQLANIGTILPAATDLLILSSIHNYGATAGPAYVAKVDAAVAAARAKVPATGIVVSGQNPQKSPAPSVSAHFARNVAIRAAALARGWGYLPVLEAFRARPEGGASFVKGGTDGVHPTTSADAPNPDNGSALWSRVGLAYLTGLEQKIVA